MCFNKNSWLQTFKFFCDFPPRCRWFFFSSLLLKALKPHAKISRITMNPVRYPEVSSSYRTFLRICFWEASSSYHYKASKPHHVASWQIPSRKISNPRLLEPFSESFSVTTQIRMKPHIPILTCHRYGYRLKSGTAFRNARKFWKVGRKVTLGSIVAVVTLGTFWTVKTLWTVGPCYSRCSGDKWLNSKKKTESKHKTYST